MKSKPLRVLAASCGLAAALLAGCGYAQDSGPAGAPAAAAAQTAAVRATPVVSSRSARQDAEAWEESRLASLAGMSAPTPAPESERGITRIIFLGDVMEYRESHPGFGAGLERNLEEALPLLTGADLVVLNHEAAPCADDFPGSVSEGIYTLGIDPESLIALREKGVPIAVNLANNHSMNFGQACLADGIAKLREAGIPVFGAGLDSADAAAPYVFEDKGNTIALLGYLGNLDIIPRTWLAGDATPGVQALTPESLGAALRSVPGGSFAAVLFHDGDEYAAGVSGEQLQHALAAARAGADIIIGAHPHVIEPFMELGGVPYFASIGNGVFDACYDFNPKGSPAQPLRESLLLEVQVRDSALYAIVPHFFYQKTCQAGDQAPSELDPSVPRDAAVIADMMARLRLPEGFDAAAYGIDASIGPGRFSGGDADRDTE